MSVAALRELLDRRFPDATPVTQQTVRPVATGIVELDCILPRGGLPRGRITSWQPTGGATAILCSACRATAAGGERAAWIDGAGSVSSFWEDGPLLFRPSGRIQALRAAEQLLRSAGFGLVVLTGVDPDPTEMVRLSRATHDSGGAFAAVTRTTVLAGLRIASTIAPDGYRWRRDPFDDPAEATAVAVRVEAQSLGWKQAVDLMMLVVPYDLRLSLEPGLADRRGLRR